VLSRADITARRRPRTSRRPWPHCAG